MASYNPEISYSEPNTQVYYSCKIWHNQWWANPGEIPGENTVWVFDTICNEGPDCGANSSIYDETLNKVLLYPNPSTGYIKLKGLSKTMDYTIYNMFGTEMQYGTIKDEELILLENISGGIYMIKLDNKYFIKFKKE